MKYYRQIPFLGFVGFTILLPNVVPDFWLYVLCLVGINSIGTLGINILTGYTAQVSLGHASFVGIGAYTTASFVGMEYASSSDAVKSD